MAVALDDDFLGEIDGAGQQFAVDDAVDQPKRVAFDRLNRRALDHHVERFSYPNKARQTLRSPGARRKAQLDLRLAQIGIDDGDAIVTPHRGL